MMGLFEDVMEISLLAGHVHLEGEKADEMGQEEERVGYLDEEEKRVGYLGLEERMNVDHLGQERENVRVWQVTVVVVLGLQIHPKRFQYLVDLRK